MDKVFGPDAPMPMLVKSNNSLERFHSHLKWKILRGLPAQTLVAFFTSWMSYLAIVKVNAVKAKIDLRALKINQRVASIASDSPLEPNVATGTSAETNVATAANDTTTEAIAKIVSVNIMR